MGYRSNVKIKMGLKAYELLDKKCNESDLDYVKEMTNDPDIFRECKEENYVLIGWNYVKWYYDYDDVKTVESVLKKCNEMVDEKPDLLKDYFYKKIEIGEDNAVTEATNDYDEGFVDDFYIECDFSL